MTETGSKVALRRETDRSPTLRKLGWYHSFEFPDGEKIDGVQTLVQLRERWARFPIPQNLSGRRVLDIGAWDGWFSFEAERRGAEVVALDCVEIPNFLKAKRRLNSSVDYRVSDLYRIPGLQPRAFDYVFFLGVLYHVKHPMLALEIVCKLTREVAIVESAIIDGPAYQQGVREEIPTLEFFETDELGGHFDNWFGPSVAALQAMCRAVGFARVELLSVTATTACVACFRNWPEPSEACTELAPLLAAVTNNADQGINVSTQSDDYLTWWFTCDRPLCRDDLQFEVGSFGCHSVSLTKRGDKAWSANTIVPPGLPQGWVQARMRTTTSGFSESQAIAVDIPATSSEISLDAVQDGVTWKVGEFHPDSRHIVLWIRGLPANADLANVRVLWDESRLVVDYVGEPDENGARQVNAQLPMDVWGATAKVLVRFGDAESNAVELKRR